MEAPSTKMPNKFFAAAAAEGNDNVCASAFLSLFSLTSFGIYDARAQKSTKIWRGMMTDRHRDGWRCHLNEPFLRRARGKHVGVRSAQRMTNENAFFVADQRKTNCFRVPLPLLPSARLFTSAASSTTQVQMLPTMQKSLVKTAFSTSSSSPLSPLSNNKSQNKRADILYLFTSKPQPRDVCRLGPSASGVRPNDLTLI